MPDGTQTHDFWIRGERSNTYCTPLLCDNFERDNIYKIYIWYFLLDITSQYGGVPYHLLVKSDLQRHIKLCFQLYYIVNWSTMILLLYTAIWGISNHFLQLRCKICKNAHVIRGCLVSTERSCSLSQKKDWKCKYVRLPTQAFNSRQEKKNYFIIHIYLLIIINLKFQKLILFPIIDVVYLEEKPSFPFDINYSKSRYRLF